MKLPIELEKKIPDNFLGNLSDKELVLFVQRNLSLLPSTNDKYDLINYKRLEKSKFDDYKSGSLTIDLLCGRLINLQKVEDARKSQLESSSEKLSSCKKILSAHKWLSGGITVNYIDNNELAHSIYLCFPLKPMMIRLKDMKGALYIDNRLVPIRSELEKNLISLLEGNGCEEDDDGAITTIITFVNSDTYLDNAIEIGRVK